MSLYNMLFGKNPNGAALLKMAGLIADEIPRFRDVYAEDGKITVYTRTGGGNRECFADGDDCSGCYHTANDGLASKPNYVTDYDDDFDSTYAYFVFTPLDEFKELLSDFEGDPKSVGDKFQALLGDLEKK